MEEGRGFLPYGTRCALPKTRQISSEVGQELGHHIGAAVCRHALVDRATFALAARYPRCLLRSCRRGLDRPPVMVCAACTSGVPARGLPKIRTSVGRSSRPTVAAAAAWSVCE